MVVNAVSIVEAKNEEEAMSKVSEMELGGCCHGSFFAGEYNANECLVMEDASGLDLPNVKDMEIEEYEEYD